MVSGIDDRAREEEIGGVAKALPILLVLSACQAAPAAPDPRIADLQRRLDAVETQLKAEQGQVRTHDLWIKSLMQGRRTSVKPTPLWDDRTHSLEGRVDDLDAPPRFKPAP